MSIRTKKAGKLNWATLGRGRAKLLGGGDKREGGHRVAIWVEMALAGGGRAQAKALSEITVFRFKFKAGMARAWVARGELLLRQGRADSEEGLC